jgi:hypothetical protein
MEGAGDSDAESRRRALWALLVLVLVAAIIGAIMVFVIGSSGGGPRRGVSDGGISSEPTQSSASHSSATRRNTTHPPPSSSARPEPTSTANPCPSATPCALPDDTGHAVEALNDFRTHHGRTAVPGAVSGKAQQCALSAGNGASCLPHYSWQPGGSTADGAKVISDIAGRGDGSQWLLDPAMVSFSVGWAYAPGAGGAPGHYECAILKFG